MFAAFTPSLTLSRTPLHYAVGATGSEFCFDPKYSFAGSDSIYRPKDILQALRVLVERGQCDPMTKGGSYFSRDYGGQTALHDCVGPIEAFKYLLDQECFDIDLSERNDWGRSVEQELLRSTFPAASELVVYLRKFRRLQHDKKSEAVTNELHCAVWNLGAIYQERNSLADARDFWVPRREGYKDTLQ